MDIPIRDRYGRAVGEAQAVKHHDRQLMAFSTSGADQVQVRRVEAQLAEVAAPVTLPSTDAIAGGLRRLLDLLADKPEVGHAALVRCGLKLRVVARPQNGRRFWLVGNLDLGGIPGGGSTGSGSGHGRNGCSNQPYPELPFELAFAACAVIA